MGFWSKLLGREPEVRGDAEAFAAAEAIESAPQDHVVELVRPFVDRASLDSAGLRMGMWAMTDEGVGVITGCLAGGIGEVTLAKADGSTKMTLSADDKAVPHIVRGDVTTLKRARIDEIPEARRPDIDRLISMGYQGGAQ